MRPLHRRRDVRVIGHPVVLTGKSDGAVAKESFQHLNRLGQAGDANAWRVVADPRAVVFTA